MKRRGRSAARSFVGPVSLALLVAFSVPAPAAGATHSWSFVSDRHVHPVRLRILRNHASASEGDIFVAPIGNMGLSHRPFYGRKGPLILDAAGNPVWQGKVPRGEVAMDFRKQVYRGLPILSWWQGSINLNGIGNGQDVIVDDHYRTLAKIRAPRGRYLDPHELQLTPWGTVLICEERRVHRDLSRFGGRRDGIVVDPVVTEWNIRRRRTVFTWDTLRHVPLAASYTPPGGSRRWDAFHLNSIAVGPRGTLLISIRDASALYLIKRGAGRIVWQLGGKRSDFKLGGRTNFARQHDARFVSNDKISLFDNEGPPGRRPQSRALLLRLNVRRRRAHLIRSYEHPDPHLLAGSQGSVQRLPDGNVFVGWGQAPYASEFSRTGKLIFDAKFPGRDESYRAYRFTWVGWPTYPPRIAVRGAANAGAFVYASWNGATQVASWQVLAGETPNSLLPIASAASEGFETVIGIASTAPYLAVRALDANGTALGTPSVAGPT